MHDFLKFLFYLGVAFQFFYSLFNLLFPAAITSFLTKNESFSARLKEVKEAGGDVNADPELKGQAFKVGCVGVLLVGVLVHFYTTLILGLLTLNWYVFGFYLVISLIRTGIRKLRKSRPSTASTVVGALIGALLEGFALVNAYQLHLTFSDVAQRLGF